MIEISIGVGMVLSLILTETLGVTAGGIIVPGYIALYIDEPEVFGLKVFVQSRLD